jgi:proline iminopeptidase
MSNAATPRVCRSCSCTGARAGANATHRRFFDPAFYRIVIFDQRGSGRSRLGRDQGQHHAASDRRHGGAAPHLGIDRWFVFGGSWGSTLALAYAEHHPEQVRGLALRGIFLCRKSEIDWFLYGLREFAPEAWRAFAGHLPESERGNHPGSLLARLSNPDPKVHMPAARAWSVYEGACSTLLPSPETVRAFSADALALGLARMEAHYFRNSIFLPTTSCSTISTASAHPDLHRAGRYDLVCPVRSADDLSRVWPQARYTIVPDAGHSAMETGTAPPLVAGWKRSRAWRKSAAGTPCPPALQAGLGFLRVPRQTGPA